MVTHNFDDTVQTINVVREILIAAPIEIAFEAALAEMGPEGQLPDGSPYPMRIEPWPGGRWYRDLGQVDGLDEIDGQPYSAGHWWGNVQVIKPPKLLEICGPMFMSYPAISHVQYRLTVEGDRTRLKITHTAMGLIPEDHRTNVNQGWDHGLSRVKEIAERRFAGKG